MKSISLFYQEGSSDKVYNIQLEDSGIGFIVNFQYGRRGNSLQAGTKTPTPVSLDEAVKIYDKLEREKRAKGYEGYEDDVKKNDFSGVNIVSSKEVIFLPQLLNMIDDVEEFINNDEFIAQEKKDGQRRLVVSELKGAIFGLNKKGTSVPLPRMIIQSINNNCILDGEIIGDKLFVFDLLSFEGQDLKNRSYEERIMRLNIMTFGENIEVVETAFTTAEKRKLFNRLKAENKEGIVFKKKNAPHKPGRPASGGDQLKFKFYNTATFIVDNITKGKRSVGLKLISGQELVKIGKVTIPPNHQIPEIGALVEVRYLYAFEGGCIFQPVYLGLREDSDLTDATIEQLVYKPE